LTKGRLIDEKDRADSVPVVVISEELARQGWPEEDPIASASGVSELVSLCRG